VGVFLELDDEGFYITFQYILLVSKVDVEKKEEENLRWRDVG
jgi:hypothetical protein